MCLGVAAAWEARACNTGYHVIMPALLQLPVAHLSHDASCTGLSTLCLLRGSVRCHTSVHCAMHSSTRLQSTPDCCNHWQLCHALLGGLLSFCV
jgi:hypothetical protein